MQGGKVVLSQEWAIGERIGGGGFGEVFLASGPTSDAVAKFVPKTSGAGRELLFVELEDVRNVVPIIDNGEHRDHWVLVMPRAEASLRDQLNDNEGVLDVDEAVAVLRDVCDALVDLEDQIVHRDLKPENVLLLNGAWCLADFGISRYTEVSTAPDTQKFALSPPYAAPERWRAERATASTDVYAVGVMAYEMLTGHLPFPGTTPEEFREQHLHADPPHLEGVSPALSALIDECLFKAPQARPSPSNLRARLERLEDEATSPGLSRLAQANQEEVRRRSAAARRASEAKTEAERRAALAEAAEQVFDQISTALLEAITTAAPSGTSRPGQRGEWSIRLNEAELQLSRAHRHSKIDWGDWEEPAFDVICTAVLDLQVPSDRSGYKGRSHSLWYGDIQEEGRFGWYETAFMISALTGRRAHKNPFALDPGEESAKALGAGLTEFQLAWPFTLLVPGELGEFIDRWGGWFADGAEGRLGHPSRMPERPIGSWRKS